MSDALRTALATIDTAAVLRPEDVLALRRAVYADGRVEATEARRLIALHKDGASNRAGADWDDFFVEAMAEYFSLDRETPDWGVAYEADYGRALGDLARAVSPFHRAETKTRTFAWDGMNAPAPMPTAEVDDLIAAFRAEGGLVLDRLERRVIIRLFDRLAAAPESLRRFALEAVWATVREDGVIEADEVELLRRVLFGPAGDGGITIARDEANLLFALHRETRTAENCPQWRWFFARALAKHVLFAGPSPEAVDGAEAAWLMAKLGNPDTLCRTERALLAFLAREAQRIDPRLDVYFCALELPRAA